MATDLSQKPVPEKKTIMTSPAGYNKKMLMAGVWLLVGAFVCVIGIVYCVFSIQKSQAKQYETTKEQLSAMNIEKTGEQSRLAEMEEKSGKTISLNKLLQEANQTYGPEEKSRKEGSLWIDRGAGVMYVTLGAVNGLTPGSKLEVYDGKELLGEVRVETPLDVIAYVRPINKTLADFEKNYYRVAAK